MVRTFEDRTGNAPRHSASGRMRDGRLLLMCINSIDASPFTARDAFLICLSFASPRDSRSARRFSSFSFNSLLLSLPRPPPFDFDLKRKTQESANHDIQRKDAKAVERRHDGDHADDVGGNQKFQSKQMPLPRFADMNEMPRRPCHIAFHGTTAASRRQRHKRSPRPRAVRSPTLSSEAHARPRLAPGH